MKTNLKKPLKTTQNKKILIITENILKELL